MTQPQIAYDGQVFEDEAAFEAHINPNIPPELKRVYITKSEGEGDPFVKPGTDPGDNKMVVDPNKFLQDQQLDDIETTPSTGMGLEIGFKTSLGSPEKPADALKPAEGSQVPEKGPISNFLSRLSIVNPVKAMMSGPNWEDDKKLLTGFYETVKNAFKLPGDVYGGKIDPMSPQGIERAFDLAGVAVLGPAPVAAKMADGTLGSFIGVKAKQYDRARLGEAQVMAANGVPTDDIFRKTGWFKGAEGRWKYEIDDSKAKFDANWVDTTKPRGDNKHFSTMTTEEAMNTPIERYPGQRVKDLQDILKHDELYKAYPELKNIKVVYDETHTSAHWDVRNNEIVIGPHYKTDKGTLMHEVQHAIQDIEGFAKGAAPGQAGKDFQLRLAEDIKPVAKRLNELYEKAKTGHLDDIEYAERKHLTFLIEKYNEYHKAANAQALEYYMRMAGEVEARNVDTRVLMTEAQRRRTYPTWTEDTPGNKQIINTDEAYMTTAYGTYDPKLKKYVKPKVKPK